MTILQSEAMKRWRETDEDGRYWIMEHLRCQAAAASSVLEEIIAIRQDVHTSDAEELDAISEALGKWKS